MPSSFQIKTTYCCELENAGSVIFGWGEIVMAGTIEVVTVVELTLVVEVLDAVVEVPVVADPDGVEDPCPPGEVLEGLVVVQANSEITESDSRIAAIKFR
jgi:hypothetical protein